jgi:hypothetical protein
MLCCMAFRLGLQGCCIGTDLTIISHVWRLAALILLVDAGNAVMRVRVTYSRIINVLKYFQLY